MPSVENEAPDAWRDNADGRIYLNGRKYDDDLLYAYDADSGCTPLWFSVDSPGGAQ